MDKDKMEIIYKKTVNNSVGRDKRCSYTKNIKNSINKIAIETLLLVFIASSLMGCTGQFALNNNVSSMDNKESYTTTVERKYSYYEIASFEKNRVYGLMEDNGLTDFIHKGNDKHYNYTAEDFKKIKELDESYLYGFYMVADRETLDEVCKALGYTDIKDYLIKNNYVDKENNPDVNVWYDSNLVNIQKIMSEQGIQRSR